MPLIIDSIDAIARRKQRDVLWLSFGADPRKRGLGKIPRRTQDWDDDPLRRETMAWLDSECISNMPCHIFWGDDLIEFPYLGDLYVDVPFDTSDECFQRLTRHFETPDGKMRIPGVAFCATSLEAAMRNAHHDELGYRDNL